MIDTYENAEDNAYATFSIKWLKAYGKDGSTLWFYYADAKWDTKASKAVDMAGSLNISRLTIAPSKASLTNSISSDDVEFKGGENSTEVSILKGTYTAKKRDVYLNEFLMSGAMSQWLENSDTADTTDALHKMTVYLYIDGKPVADSELKVKNSEWEAGDTFTNVLVKAGETVDVELKAQVDADSVVDANGDTITAKLIISKRFTLYIWWEDENGNPNAWKADKQTSKISVVSKGTAEVETSKARKTVLLRWVSDAIAEFTVKPSGGSSFDLESVRFDKPTWIACDNLKLEWPVSEEFEERSINGTDVCVADGFVEGIDANGEVVKIVFEDEPSYADESNASLIEVAVNNIYINGKKISNTFSKAYADAILTFNQADNKSYTKYTIADIKKYNGATEISNLRFFNANNEEFKTSLTASDILSKDDTFTIDNTFTSERIEKIVYTVTRNGFSQEVTVLYSAYPDYFRTNNDDLRVFDNGKDTWNKNANKIGVTTTTYLPVTIAVKADDGKVTVTEGTATTTQPASATALTAGSYYTTYDDSGTTKYLPVTIAVSATDGKVTVTEGTATTTQPASATALTAGSYYTTYQA